MIEFPIDLLVEFCKIKEDHYRKLIQEYTAKQEKEEEKFKKTIWSRWFKMSYDKRCNLWTDDGYNNLIIWTRLDFFVCFLDELELMKMLGKTSAPWLENRRGGTFVSKREFVKFAIDKMKNDGTRTQGTTDAEL